MTNDEMNRKISNLREPTSRNWRYRGFYGDWIPCDWTGSEDASAVLLEEMPEPDLFYAIATCQWNCSADGFESTRSEDRKVAIALAWLRWKELA